MAKIKKTEGEKEKCIPCTLNVFKKAKPLPFFDKTKKSKND